MSCQHGNWAPCELCDEIDAAYEAGKAEGIKESKSQGSVSDDARDAARLDEIARRAEKVVGSRGIHFELRFEPLSGRGLDLIDYIDAAIKSQGESNV